MGARTLSFCGQDKPPPPSAPNASPSSLWFSAEMGKQDKVLFFLVVATFSPLECGIRHLYPDSGSCP